MNAFMNLKGQKFGRLTVIQRIKKRSSNHIIWLCRCECGNLKEVIGYNLTTGGTKSCGCLQVEANRINPLKHGGWGTKLYAVWVVMKARCYYSNNKAYKYYGARGIKVCDDWRKGFVFFRDFALSHGWKEGLVTDRIDNDGNYEPSNIQFITKSEHALKGSNSRARDFRGMFMEGEIT